MNEHICNDVVNKESDTAEQTVSMLAGPAFTTASSRQSQTDGKTECYQTLGEKTNKQKSWEMRIFLDECTIYLYLLFTI